MSDREPQSDSDNEQETAIDDIDDAGLPPEATGYSSDEFEVEEHSTPVPSPLSASSPAPNERGNRSASARLHRGMDEDVSAHSPFVPEESSSSSGASSTLGVSLPPLKTRGRAPPTYSQVSQSGRRGEEVGDAEANENSADSADESTSFLRSQRLQMLSEDVSGVRIEMVGVASDSDPLAEDEQLPKPPPYSIAVARVGAGISRQIETNFGPEITTNVVPSDEEREVVDGHDEPPPGYCTVDRQPDHASAEPSDDVEANSTTESGRSCGGFHSTFLSSLQCSCGDSRGKRAVIITSVVASLVVLCVILFPIQFSYVSYYQFGLVRTRSTGKVATDRVYEHGCYVLGADKEFVYLDRTVQPIDFNEISMFTKDNVDLSIDVKLYYHLNYEDVGQLWRDYAGEHAPVIKSAALTVIRNCAPRVYQDEYLLKREYVRDLLHDAIIEKFDGWGVNVTYLNYLNLYLPERVLQKKLKLLLIRTDIEKEHAYQLQREIELGTELLTTPVIYEAKEAINNGTYEAAAIRTIAETEKAQYVDTAHANAFNSMMNTLNVTQQDYALSFYYLATLNTMDHYGGVVEYAKHGAYMP